jgi:hypothetical protein
MGLNQRQRQWVSCAGIFTLATVATASITPPALSQASPQLAQAAASIVGQCRSVNKQTPLFKDRSTASTAVALLKPNDKVTIAENTGQNGLIAVSSPAAGYVIMNNLKLCSSAPTPTPKPTPPAAGACRLVTQSQGLAVRKEPASQAAVVGSVIFNQKVTLVSPPERKTNPDGRMWVKLAAPVSGWVSEGFKDGGMNLGNCP